MSSILKKSRCLSPTASHPTLTSLQDSLRHLKTTLESIPSASSLSPLDARKKHKHVKYPKGVQESLGEVQWKVGYERPLRINVVGYWPAGLALKTQGRFTVDLAVEMPEVRSLPLQTVFKNGADHDERAEPVY